MKTKEQIALGEEIQRLVNEMMKLLEGPSNIQKVKRIAKINQELARLREKILNG